MTESTHNFHCVRDEMEIIDIHTLFQDRFVYFIISIFIMQIDSVPLQVLIFFRHHFNFQMIIFGEFADQIAGIIIPLSQ